MITAERLRECLDYDPETGIFRRAAGTKFGSIAGGPWWDYWRISVDGKRYYAHHLAWLYVYGVWPKQLDHKDMNCKNNAIINLREATTKQNNRNKPHQKNNVLGIKGVRKRTKNSYEARIKINDKQEVLGYFKTAEEAHQAYLNASKTYYGEFARG